MKKFKFYRLYNDESTKERISKKEFYNSLKLFYKDVDLLLQFNKKVNTPSGVYWYE